MTGNKKGWASKGFFKKAGNTFKPKMRSCLLRIDTLPVEGASKITLFPPGSYENVTCLYFGGNGRWDATFGQNKADLARMGITVIDDIDRGWPIWTKAEAAWYRVNGWHAGTFDWTRAEPA